MRRTELAAWGTSIGTRTVRYGADTRHRIADDRGQLDLLADAAMQAIERSARPADEIDCVIAACAAGIQPIPCTAALVMERVAPHARAAAFDINSTCTSFITALDIASRYLDAGTYRRILIVSGDVGSRFLDPTQRESAELFSDAGAAVILTPGEGTTGVLASLQQTWPQHAHDTELRGGLSAHPAQAYPDGDPADYLFDMQGRTALRNMLRVLPAFFERFFDESGTTAGGFDRVIPHQASGALGIAMRRIRFPRDSYVDAVRELGNMVSSSVPFVLSRELDAGRVRRGDTVLLCGTAAGLTANALALRL